MNTSFRRAALALAILGSLAACDRAAEAPQATTAPATADAPVAGTGVGIDLAAMDKAVQPGDDFDAYANGAWAKATEIPADRGSVSTFFYVGEKAEKRLSDLVQGLETSNPAAATNERKVADYYAAYMDEAGYPPKADPKQVNKPMVVGLLFLLMLYVTMVYGPVAAALVEMFPARIRYTSMSLPYHIGNGWFGGFLPTTAFAMVAATGNIYFGLWYPIVIAAATAVVGFLFVREMRGANVDD